MPRLSLLGAVLLIGLGHLPCEAQVLRQDLWGANSTVRAAVVSRNTLYLGGDFTYLGPRTGCGVPLDATTGVVVTPFPEMTSTGGQSFAVAADGAGGFREPDGGCGVIWSLAPRPPSLCTGGCRGSA